MRYIMPGSHESSRSPTESGSDGSITGPLPTLQLLLLHLEFAAPIIEHWSTGVPETTTGGATAGSITQRFSRDTRKDGELEKEGDETVQTAALEAVTKTGTKLLRDKEITDAIRAGKGGGDHHGRWRSTECDEAIKAAKDEYVLTEDDHKTAVNEAKDAGCTQQSVDNAKASAKPPGRNDVEEAVLIYYQRARYHSPASVEGGSSGGTEGMKQ
jgi:hypothetical protein